MSAVQNIRCAAVVFYFLYPFLRSHAFCGYKNRQRLQRRMKESARQMAKITIDNFQQAVQEALDEYGDEISENVKEAVHKTALLGVRAFEV